MNRRYKLAAFTSHPIQYQAPLFRILSAHPAVDLKVYFFTDIGVKRGFDNGFRIDLEWDIPLLEGYNYNFLQNLAPRSAPGFWTVCNRGILRELIANEFDAVWVHGYGSLSALLVIAAANLRRIPVMLRGESNLRNFRPGWKRAIKQIALKGLFSRIGVFLSVGSLNEEYYRHYGVPHTSIFNVPYCVDNEFFQNRHHELLAHKEELKRREGIAPGATVILFASKMMPRKRAMDLLIAYHRIRGVTDATLVFVGDGAERPALERYAMQNELDTVRFTGFKNQTELPAYFAMADVFVLPSENEPWGLIINEAMNFELPIVTTNEVGAAPDLVRHGENGYMYTSGDVDALARILLCIIRDEGLRKNMGKRSLEIINNWGFKEDVHGIVSSLEYLRRCGRIS